MIVRRTMIVMTFTIEFDIPLSYLLQPLASDRSRDNTHRRGPSRRSYGHCRRRTEIPEAAFNTPQAGEASFPVSAVMFVDAALPHPGFSWRESVPTGLAEQMGSGVDEPLWPRP
jgi:hypothetical protein